ncbi:MAG: hypothetical protein ACI4JS_03205 [Oscillospiraceae bacterium]
MKKVLESFAIVAISLMLAGCTSPQKSSESHNSTSYVESMPVVTNEISDVLYPADTSQYTASTQEELVFGMLNALGTKNQLEFDRYPSSSMSKFERFYSKWCGHLQSKKIDYTVDYTYKDFSAYISPSFVDDGKPSSVNVYFPAEEPVLRFFVNFDFDYITEKYSISDIYCSSSQHEIHKAMSEEKNEPIDFSLFVGGENVGE